MWSRAGSGHCCSGSGRGDVWAVAGLAGAVWLSMSGHLFGLVIRWLGAQGGGAAGGGEGGADLLVVQAGLAGGCGERAEVGGVVGVEGAVRGPEQACVAVALVQVGDPRGQAADVTATGGGLPVLRLPARIRLATRFLVLVRAVGVE